jgi:hypothetical protein
MLIRSFSIQCIERTYDDQGNLKKDKPAKLSQITAEPVKPEPQPEAWKTEMEKLTQKVNRIMSIQGNTRSPVQAQGQGQQQGQGQGRGYYNNQQNTQQDNQPYNNQRQQYNRQQYDNKFEWRPQEGRGYEDRGPANRYYNNRTSDTATIMTNNMAPTKVHDDLSNHMTVQLIGKLLNNVGSVAQLNT